MVAILYIVPLVLQSVFYVEGLNCSAGSYWNRTIIDDNSTIGCVICSDHKFQCYRCHEAFDNELKCDKCNEGWSLNGDVCREVPSPFPPWGIALIVIAILGAISGAGVVVWKCLTHDREDDDVPNMIPDPDGVKKKSGKTKRGRRDPENGYVEDPTTKRKRVQSYSKDESPARQDEANSAIYMNSTFNGEPLGDTSTNIEPIEPDDGNYANLVSPNSEYIVSNVGSRPKS